MGTHVPAQNEHGYMIRCRLGHGGRREHRKGRDRRARVEGGAAGRRAHHRNAHRARIDWNESSPSGSGCSNISGSSSWSIRKTSIPSVVMLLMYLSARYEGSFPRFVSIRMNMRMACVRGCRRAVSARHAPCASARARRASWLYLAPSQRAEHFLNSVLEEPYRSSCVVAQQAARTQ